MGLKDFFKQQDSRKVQESKLEDLERLRSYYPTAINKPYIRKEILQSKKSLYNLSEKNHKMR